MVLGSTVSLVHDAVLPKHILSQNYEKTDLNQTDFSIKKPTKSGPNTDDLEGKADFLKITTK